MYKRGLSSIVLALLVVVLVVAASAAAVAIEATPTSTSASQTVTQFFSSATSVSQSGLRLSLSVAPTVTASGDFVTVSISDFNTLAAANAPAIIGPPTAGGSTLTVGPCSQIPLGFGIFYGYYQASNISEAVPLQIFKPGVYMCPAEFAVSYYSFAAQSDEVSLYSQQPIGSGNATTATKMWTDPDASSQNFSGYWPGQASPLASGGFQPFQPGVYTVVGGDYWGQLTILHFTIGAANTTTTSSSGSTTASTGASASVASIQGLQLSAALNATVLQPGETLQVALSEFNTLATSNNVTAARQWPVQVALGACPNLNEEPIGIAVYPGHVDAQNVSDASSLQIFPLVPCPMIIRLVTGYYFQPQSDMAVVLPGTGASPMTGEVNVSMIYSGGAHPLPQGVYTVVAADEWGAAVFLYFTVV